MKRSIAQEAKLCDPHGCELPKYLAMNYWRVSNFIDSEGNCHVAYSVNMAQGILSITFADGSILNMPHWSI